jgi:hypothetical protein
MTRNQRWLDKIERRFGRFAVPNVTVALILGQVLLYILVRLQNRPDILANAILVPNLVLRGEVWRLVTFLFVPPRMNLLFGFFFWYLFYIMGTALEQHWGAFRYNVFLLVGFVATIAVSFLTAQTRAAPSSNLFVQGSVFLAFAHVYPDFVLNLFFVLPIKIKWLALVAWLGYGYGFVTSLASGNWIVALLIFASVANFVLFFGGDIVGRLRSKQRRRAWETRQRQEKAKPRHTCVVCGVTNLTDPKMQFRYCTKCVGQCGYCTEHLHNHEHVTEE